MMSWIEFVDAGRGRGATEASVFGVIVHKVLNKGFMHRTQGIRLSERHISEKLAYMVSRDDEDEGGDDDDSN